MVERRHLAGYDGGGAQGQGEDRGAELDAARARRSPPEEHQGVEHVRRVKDTILGPDRVETERLHVSEELRVGLARAQRGDRRARHVNADGESQLATAIAGTVSARGSA